MAETLHVVVRVLPSSGLETAFRVHVLPESLEQAQLKVGDLCEISCEDGSVGYGIAWRADDRMGNRPKNRPLKMTEAVRSAFGFQEGSKVMIKPTTAKVVHADKIVLTDVTPADYVHSKDDGCWKYRTAGLFCDCEALAPGTAFDVVAKNKRHGRKRFYIENIISSSAPSDTPSLYFFSDSTEIVFAANSRRLEANVNGDGADLTEASQSQSSRFQLQTDRIGGLLEQIRTLNRRLQRLINTPEPVDRASGRSPHQSLLLHGYEGTGKTLILNRLADAPFRKVVRLNRASLAGGSVAKNQSIIQASFRDAIAHQPALILMDDLETLVPNDDVAYSSILSTELENLNGTRIMVIGATRALSNVNSSVLGPGRFLELIELSIPNLPSREEIVNILRGKPVYSVDVVTSEVAAQTHGFTGKDLAWLYGVAQRIADDRQDEERENLAAHRASCPPAYHELHRPNNATPEKSSRLSDEEDHALEWAEISMRDFHAARQNVHPTALREIITEKPNVRWADIGGSDQIRQSFDEIIGWPSHEKEAMAKFGWQPPKGILLYGPPGCSKTLTAQAVANTYNFNFIAIKGAELISMYVGESERAIREVFRKAKTAAPCVIFFDEIDAIGSDRDTAGTKGLNVLTTLLNEMDGFETLRDVLILAATNKPETLDPALMRPGRFDSHVYMGPPNADARRDIFHIATRGVAVAGKASIDHLVARTEGCSGAEIASICQMARKAATKRYIADRAEDTRLTAADFQSGLEQCRRGITDEMLQAYEAFARGRES